MALILAQTNCTGSKGRTVQEENPGAWRKGTVFVRGGLKKTLFQISNIQI